MMRCSPKLVVLSSAIPLILSASCSSTHAPESPEQPWQPPPTREERSSVQTIPVDHPLQLSELLELASIHNPSLRVSWQNARASEFSTRQAQAQYYPQAQGTLSASINQTDANMQDGNLKDTALTPKATLTWLLLDMGGRAATVDQADFNTLAANYQFNKAFLDLRLQVEQAYYGLYGSQAGVIAAETSLDNSRTNLEAAQKRFDAGLVTHLEVLQAQADYDAAVYALDNARGSVQDSLAQLAQAVGLSAETPLQIVTPEDSPLDLSTNELHLLIEEGLARRPDISAQRATLRSREASVRAARSDLWPTLNAGASAQANRHSYSEESSALTDDDYTVMAYLALQWDFFDGFLRLNQLNAAKANLEAEKARLQAAEITAVSDIWTAYYGLQTAIKKLQSAKALLTSSEASYELALEAYNAGLKSLLDLLQAQSSLADARNKLVGAQRDVFVARASLLHALGLLFSDQSNVF